MKRYHHRRTKQQLISYLREKEKEFLHFDGEILEVCEELFFARIFDLDDETKDPELIEIFNHAVPAKEKSNIREGTLFKWTLYGLRIYKSKLVFYKQGITPEIWEESKKEAERLAKLLSDCNKNPSGN